MAGNGTEGVRLRALIEEATVDCYNASEQATGLLTMIEEHVRCPFEALIVGASAPEVVLTSGYVTTRRIDAASQNRSSSRVDAVTSGRLKIVPALARTMPRR